MEREFDEEEFLGNMKFPNTFPGNLSTEKSDNRNEASLPEIRAHLLSITCMILWCEKPECASGYYQTNPRTTLSGCHPMWIRVGYPA